MDVDQVRYDNWNKDAYPYTLPAVRAWEKLQLHEKEQSAMSSGS